MIEITINGSKISYNQCEAKKSIGFGAGGFSFLIGGDSSYQKKDHVQIFIDKTQVINGKIEKIIDVSNKDESHKIYMGRDFTGDFIDSYFNKVIEFNKNQLLTNLISQVSSNFDIQVESEISDVLFNNTELPTAEVGENIFNFYNRLCTIRSVLLTSSNNGNILLTRRGISNANDILKFGNTGNIVEKQLIDDDTLLYDEYTIYSQNNSVLDELNYLPNNKGVVGSGIRTKSFIEINSLTPNECTKRAEFERELYIRKAWRYEATVSGHSQSNGSIWDKNLKVKLKDEKSKIDQQTVIKTICWKQSGSEEKSIIILEKDV